MAGDIKRGLGTLIGNAGEYYVVAELLTRGVIAALAPRNAPAFDILATRVSKGSDTVSIRVKTRSGANDDWQWMAKEDGEIFRLLDKRKDFTVLVHYVPEKREALSFWVVPSIVLDGWLKADFKKWLATPGKNGRPHSLTNRKRHLQYRLYNDRLERYRDAWGTLWGE